MGNNRRMNGSNIDFSKRKDPLLQIVESDFTKSYHILKGRESKNKVSDQMKNKVVLIIIMHNMLIQIHI
jgi:hypothetical protein